MPEMESWLKHTIDYLPPSDEEDLIVNGRRVPHVKIKHHDGGRLFIRVGIHAFETNVFDGEAILGLVADAIAVGAGYVAWPAEDADFITAPFAGKCFIVTGVTRQSEVDDGT